VKLKNKDKTKTKIRMLSLLWLTLIILFFQFFSLARPTGLYVLSRLKQQESRDLFVEPRKIVFTVVVKR